MGGRKKSDRSAAPAAAPMVRPHVTSHAIVRYCQRVLGVTPFVRGHYSVSELARIHVAAAGRARPKEIVDEILSPAVCAAIGAGFTLFGTRRFIVIATTTGIIKTIEEPYATRLGRRRHHIDRIEARDRFERDGLRDLAKGIA